MKIVVFGGSGFLGSHVADMLSEKGHEVTIYDLKKSRYLNKKQQMVVGDILDEALVNKALDGCEIAYNFAAISDIDECAVKPLEVARYNVMGNSVILEAAKSAKIRRYLFASSSYVYSNYGSFYKSSKQACELFIHSYHEKYGLPYTILRYGSLYGDRANAGNSIYKILKEAVSTGKITYHGSGDEVREYIHARDAAALSVKVLAPEYENKNIMLTGNYPMRYRDILDMINEMLGNKIEVVYTRKDNETHYKLTNYNYKKPEPGRKLVSDQFIDLGAGLLECIEEISKDVGEKVA
ncbi:MAG: NAD(P)-dependent oxidoreductase [Candidatus Omnitrophica bacterium]|nr:NAD(P)-dependent oxidoreductase [Candidatus Omnitrophota bacterium]